MHIGNHGGDCQVILLHCEVWTKGKQSGCWPIIGYSTNAIYSRNTLRRDVLGPDIPRPCFSWTMLVTGANQTTNPTYPFIYCNIFPFLDQAIHCGPEAAASDRFKTRMVRGGSFSAGFETLQTFKSPFNACVANMSDFCFDDDACHDKLIKGDGLREIVSVCRMLKVGWSVASRTVPFWYLTC